MQSESVQESASLEAVLTPPKAGRSLLVGRTGSGKSTLAEVLLRKYLEAYRDARLLIVDSKPRFQAQWEVSGISAKKRYKRWAYGSYVPGSYAVPLNGNIKRALDSIWAQGSRIAIAQTHRIEEWRALQEVTRVFYEDYGAKPYRLVYVDELSDFFEVKQSGGIFWQIARSGRERNVSLLGSTQRPRYMPTVIMTEMERLYLFELDYTDDMKRLYEMGLPKDTATPEAEHSFFYYDKKLKARSPSGRYYQLSLPD